VNYKELVLSVYPNAVLERTFSGVIIMDSVTDERLSDDRCFESWAWQVAWKWIEHRMLTKLGS
jgi:hypothetical protein